MFKQNRPMNTQLLRLAMHFARYSFEIKYIKRKQNLSWPFGQAILRLYKYNPQAFTQEHKVIPFIYTTTSSSQTSSFLTSFSRDVLKIIKSRWSQEKAVQRVLELQSWLIRKYRRTYSQKTRYSSKLSICKTTSSWWYQFYAKTTSPFSGIWQVHTP